MHKNVIVNLILIFNVSVHHYGLLCTCIGLATMHTVPRPLPWKWIREAMFVAGRIVKQCAGKQNQNNAGLPAMSMPTSNSVHPHDTSVALLRDNCPWILAKYVPCDVGIDGNRLFRSVSLALYGTE